MQMTEARHWFTFKIIVLYCFLSSARACMTLGDNPYIDLILSVIALIVVPKNYFIHTPQRVYASFLLAIAAMYTMLGSTITGYLAQFAMVFIPVQLIFLKKKDQINLFEWLSKWYAILLCASFTWWLLWLIGVPLPHTEAKLAWQHDDWGFIQQNYFLFRHSIALNPYRLTETFFRFNGFFLEPGHLGTITSIFLFVNKYDFRKWTNIVFIVIIVLSLSSAAYALTIIGYCFYRYTIDRWKAIFPIIFIVGGILIVSQILNNGDNVINEFIIGKFTREQGAIEGRFSEQTKALWNQAIFDGSIYFGMGAGAQLKESAGYKVFLLMNGIFGAFLTLIAYWKIQRINYSQLGKYLFLLMIISFLQRTYCFWDAFLDPYILGMPILQLDNHEND